MTLRILLADDHAILREGIRRSFESAGEVIVGEAANGQEALAMALGTRPDIIVMDLSMPVLDGIDATRAIKLQLPEAKIVVLTMHDDVDATRRALEAGAAGFMSKGSSFAEVLATVRGVASGEVGFSPELAAAMLAVARDQLAFDARAGVASIGASDPSMGGGIGVGGDQAIPDVIDLNAEPAPGSLLSERQVEILQAIADGATTKQVARQLNITQKTVHNHLNAIYRRLDTQSLTHAVLSAVRLGIIELE